MPSINLAPGSQYVLAAKKRRRRLVGWSLLIVIVVAGSWGALFVYTQRLERQQDGLQGQIRGVQLEIARLSSDVNRITLFERRLVSLRTLLDNHIRWDAVLTDLERLLPTPVVLMSIEAGVQEKQLTVTGETPDVDVVAQTLATLTRSAGHSTVFVDGAFEGAERKENIPLGADGVPAGPPEISYAFAAKLELDPAATRSVP